MAKGLHPGHDLRKKVVATSSAAVPHALSSPAIPHAQSSAASGPGEPVGGNLNPSWPRSRPRGCRCDGEGIEVPQLVEDDDVASLLSQFLQSPTPSDLKSVKAEIESD